MAQRTGIAQKDANLAIVHLPSRATIVAGNASRVSPLFQKAGLVDHQHHVWVCQMLHYVGAQLIADGLGVPQRAAQQMLKGLRRGVAAHFGQLPAVLVLGWAQQAPPIGHDSLPGLGPFAIGGQAALDIG